MRRAWICALLAVSLAVVTASDAQACNASRRAAASGSHNGRAPLIIGDSTMIFAAPYLGRRGLEADAKGCRQFAEGMAILSRRARAGTLPRLSILALGANGAANSDAISRALEIVGSTRALGLVTPRNSASTRAAMQRAARAHPDRVLLIDWVAYSGGHGGWFGGDGLHVNDIGARAFTALVARRAAVNLRPAKALRVPRGSKGTKACGTIRRFHRTLRVHVPRGADRITCKRAREVARRPPLGGLRGWRIYDWRDAKPGPWQEIYARADRRVLVGTVRAK